ncbi:MAG: YraN family protein [Roseiflexaceae bacterium]
MSSARQRGFDGEQRAATFLQRRGFVIVTHNWHCREGEIDIVTVLDQTWVFVEVRYRAQGRTTALDSINFRKVKRLIQAAQQYLQTHQLDNVDWRIDVVVIDRDDIEHIPHAIELH